MEDGWRALAILPSVTFAQGEAGQQIRLDFFDGSRLLWTVQDMIFDGVLSEIEEPQEGAQRTVAVRKAFRGTLQFDCTIKI